MFTISNCAGCPRLPYPAAARICRDVISQYRVCYEAPPYRRAEDPRISDYLADVGRVFKTQLTPLERRVVRLRAKRGLSLESIAKEVKMRVPAYRLFEEHLRTKLGSCFLANGLWPPEHYFANKKGPGSSPEP